MKRPAGADRQQVGIVGAEGEFIGIALVASRVDEAFRTAGAALVGDDDRRLHQLVFADDRLDGAREDIGAAAGTGGDDEFDRTVRLEGRCRCGKADSGRYDCCNGYGFFHVWSSR